MPELSPHGHRSPWTIPTSHIGAWLVPSKFLAFLLFSLHPQPPPAYLWHHISSSDQASLPQYSDSAHYLLSDVQSLWCKIHGSLSHSLISLYTPSMPSTPLPFADFCFYVLQAFNTAIYLHYSKALVSFNPGSPFQFNINSFSELPHQYFLP